MGTLFFLHLKNVHRYNHEKKWFLTFGKVIRSMRGRNKTHDMFFLGQPFVKNYLYMNRTYFGTRAIHK